MAEFLPTDQALIRLAGNLDREPTDQEVVRVFDARVLRGCPGKPDHLRGHIKPFVPGWWEICRLNQRVVLSVARRCGLSC
jgi:hypothetical protein